MRHALFIDRDGVINSDIGHYYIYKPEDFFLNEGVFEVIREAKSRDWYVIVITNQGGISKQLYDHKDVAAVHKKMIDLLSKEGITIDAIYYCPHHDSNELCFCRKPQPLMIEKALARFNIDENHAVFVGDRKSDVETAKRAGIRHVKIKTNDNLLKYRERIFNS